LRINVRLFARPIGEFSIAGSQMKVGSFDPDGKHVSFPRHEED
jgi:hypothetical protein